MLKLPNYFCLRFILIAFLTILDITNVSAAETIVQPIGNLVQVWSPVLVNRYLAKWDPNIIPGVTDPFDTHFAVTEIQPTKAMYFVRVYTGTNSIGTFLLRASSVRGLTPQQIKNIAALENTPTKIEYVKVPAGAQYGLWTGIAGPINSPGHRWGNGGAEQIKIINKHTDQNPPLPDPARFANYTIAPIQNYMNGVLIGNKALSYTQSVSSGNAGKVAAYLDHHLPQPYSDMEDVYTTLDFINADGPPELAAALNQISPINFDTYSTVFFRNELLFQKNLFEHTQDGYENINVLNLKSCTKQPLTLNRKCFASWVNLAAEQGEQSQGTNRVGFYYQTGALMAGTDCQILPNVKVGAAAAYFRDHLGWNASGGNADLNNVKVGIYSNYFNSDYFLNSSLTGGANWNSAERNMNFTGNGFAVLTGLLSDTLTVNRTATSDQTGQNLGLNFIGGKNLQFNEWNLLPTAQISYFYSRQDSFDESGAADLNLHVQDFSAQTIRTQLALLLGKLFCTPQGSIVKASLQLGWAHNFPLDNRVITASLPALGGDFSVNGYNQQTNELLASASISTKVIKKFWVDAQYNAFLSHGFNSQAVSVILKYYFDI